MRSDEGEFWDRRYLAEGAIWGDGPSPAAEGLARHVRPGDRVLDVGFGYGRDLVFLGRRGCRVSGIEAAAEGRRQAAGRLERAGVVPEGLVSGCFGSARLPAEPFDAALCHRLIHLFVAPGTGEAFAAYLGRTVRPGGLLAVGTRSPRDLDPAAMLPLGDGVYEYRARPGHRIRYWTGDALARALGPAFAVLDAVETAEPESRSNPVPCRLTIVLARKSPWSPNDDDVRCQ